MGPGLAALQEAGCPEGQHQGSAHGSWAGPAQCQRGGAPRPPPAPGPADGSCIVKPLEFIGPGPRRGWEGLRERRCGQPSLESLLPSPPPFPYPQRSREMTLPSLEAPLITANPGLI